MEELRERVEVVGTVISAPSFLRVGRLPAAPKVGDMQKHMRWSFLNHLLE